MNRFDELVKKHYDAVPEDRRYQGFLDESMRRAKSDLEQEVPLEKARLVMFRSSNWWCMNFTEAAVIQRSVILQLLDEAKL
jgi:hypothetical protein